MSTVVCVLKSGGHYTPEWAWKLKAGVEQYLPGADFRCLTDMEGVPGAVPLLKDRPGWWSLPEWYRPLFEGRVIALGLDTLIVGDLSELAAYDGPLAGIDDLYRPRHLASGVMTWRGDEAAHLWEAFDEQAGHVMAHFRRHDLWLRTVAPDAERLQDHVSGIYSYKAHCRGGLPEDAVIVCGHGRPRFDDPGAGWAHEWWRGLPSGEAVA